MELPTTRTSVPSAIPRPPSARHRIWARNTMLFLGTVVILFAFDTLRNSCGDFQELRLSRGVEHYIAAHPELSESDKTDLRAGRVVKGWSREKCRLAWGEPRNVVTITQMGTEIWQYGDSARPATLVFTNGILTDFGP